MVVADGIKLLEFESNCRMEWDGFCVASFESEHRPRVVP